MGCFSAAGTEALKFLRKICCPLPERCQWEEGLPSNNDPKHTGKLTTQWLNEKKVNVLAWPSQSPDLNPTENLWNDSKTAVHKCSPSNLTELEQFCKEEWANIAKSRCAKLVETNPNRLKAVIKAKGGSTKYWHKGVILFPTQWFCFWFSVWHVGVLSFTWML